MADDAVAGSILRKVTVVVDRMLEDDAADRRSGVDDRGGEPLGRGVEADEQRHDRYQDACTSGRIRRSYTSRTASIVRASSGDTEAAPAFSRACASVLAPGIAQVTASNIRIQRSAKRARVASTGTSPRSSSTAASPAS